MLSFLSLVAIVIAASLSVVVSSDTTTTTTTGFAGNSSKTYKICSVEIGLEIARLISSRTRNVFSSAIEDVEFMREYMSEAMHNGGIVSGIDISLDKLAATLDWEARRVPNGTTTFDLNLGWTDDRPDRRVERYVSTINDPLVGSKEADLAMVDTLSNVIPWVVDRKAKESFWWISHDNGRSEGPTKERFSFDQLYTAAWVGTYGEAWLYYPPIRVWGHPFTLGDIEGPAIDSHDMEFFRPNLPEYNPTREAAFSVPYPDVTVPGLSMISAMAPVYYTGDWRGYNYNDTFVAVVGVDIAIISLSTLLDELRGTLTENSFALLVDNQFRPIVITQEIVNAIYPERTGMEESRITFGDPYNPSYDDIIEDRRNVTYMVSDTIFQSLTNLTNANWTSLYSAVMELGPGGRGFSVLNITLTGDTDSTMFYVMYERWPDVDDFVLLALAPFEEVDKAINVMFSGQDNFYLQVVEGNSSLTSAAVFANSGSLDVTITLLPVPDWIHLHHRPKKQVVKAGETVTLEFDILSLMLSPGTTTSTLVTLHVEDAQYPDCYYSQILSFRVTAEYRSTSSGLGAGPVVGIVAATILLFLFPTVLYFDYKRKQNDSAWRVSKEDLVFDDPVEIVGRGTFGLVMLAEYRGTQVAVKQVIPPRHASTSSIGSQNQSMIASALAGASSTLDKSTSSRHAKHGSKYSSMRFHEVASWQKLKNDFIIEMRILSKLRHPCITTVMGAVIGKNQEPMLVMEYMLHGSLFDMLHNDTVIIDSEIRVPILRDISQGVRFLHAIDPPVIHGDLKAQNILVDNKFRAKVADFGLSQKKSTGVVGTPGWMAPELIRGESGTTAASDVYSFGVILYEVYSRKEPYEGEDLHDVLRLVADPTVNKRPSPMPKGCPAQVKTLMEDCLMADPTVRPTFEELDIRLKRVDVDNQSVQVVPTDPLSRQSTISLFDIFPRHIAQALQEGRQVEPEHKECVTIFFSDIIGFTEISAELPPAKVSDMLDRLYIQLDELSNKYEIFKVETIGDSYMAVTNLVRDQADDHVKRIAEFSIEALAAANATYIDSNDHSRGFVHMRVGFHSGPVVADVVGNRNPRYCLFGDTVNTASRMESYSAVNRIQCSERSAELLKIQHPNMPVTPRGIIDVKGKGEMPTFWIN